jgi:hypothetical protein
MHPPGGRPGPTPMSHDDGPSALPQDNHARPPGVECVVGETLCRARVMSEAEWAALPEDRRPRVAEYFPGLGWVVALPRGKD